MDESARRFVARPVASGNRFSFAGQRIRHAEPSRERTCPAGMLAELNEKDAGCTYSGVACSHSFCRLWLAQGVAQLTLKGVRQRFVHLVKDRTRPGVCPSAGFSGSSIISVQHRCGRTRGHPRPAAALPVRAVQHRRATQCLTRSLRLLDLIERIWASGPDSFTYFHKSCLWLRDGDLAGQRVGWASMIHLGEIEASKEGAG